MKMNILIFIIILSIIILVIYFLINNNNIPPILWKTGKSPISNILKDYFKELETLNPEYTVIYLDNTTARSFISKNFPNKVLNAYDKIIPGAYKADILRYCLLYKFGGVYSDVKQRLNQPLHKLIDRKSNLILSQDLNPHDIQISFMAAKPGLKIFQELINRIVYYIENNEYTEHYLALTGPKLFGKILRSYSKDYYTIKFKQSGPRSIIDLNTRKIIITKDHSLARDIVSGEYRKQWRERRIYI